MGKVWVCTDEPAERPLVVGPGLSLYTFEELCYYLYQNVESVEESFYNEMLCHWLSHELGRRKLGEQIRRGLEQEKSGCWCLQQILDAGGYYSQKEVGQAVQTAKNMEDKDPAQRAKLKGDRYLRSGKYQEARKEYLKALEEESDQFFQGRVWHNLGTVYARQFLFGNAIECYKRAYETGQGSESSEAYLLALACHNGQIPAQEEAGIEEFIAKLQEKKQSGDRAGYEEIVEGLLLQLRTEYRKSE